MKKIQKFSVLLFLLLGLLSCDKTNPLIEKVNFTIENFPVEIGTVWKYQYKNNDIQNFSTDTFFVLIDDTIRITTDSLLVYKILAEEITDSSQTIITTYWHISGDTVTYYKPVADSFLVTHKLVFPLEVGASWSSGTSSTDSSEVLEISSKTVLGVNYPNAMHIQRDFGDSQYYYEDYWYIPNIGLLSSSVFTTFFPSPNDVDWKLIEFYTPDSLVLSDFPLQVNASWDYKVVNNLIDCPTCYDSVTVTILDSSMVNNEYILEHWLIDYPGKNLIIQPTIEGNKLVLQWHHYTVFFSLEFPLIVGKKWISGDQAYSSSIQVLDIQNVTTTNDTILNTFYLKGNTINNFEPGADIEIWIAKDIGIVKLSHNVPPIGSYEDKTWKLDSYKP